MKRKISILAVALAALLVAGERPGNFQVIGPGGGGAMFLPTFSPHDANTALMRCDMTGAYITHDGGRSWRMFNLRGVVQFFVFDPLEPHTMYAQTSGLWRSTDDGASWKLVWPKPSMIRGIRMNSDHAEEEIVAEGNELGTMTALAIDPGDSRTLFAGAGNALFVSRDAGESWVKQRELGDAPMRIWVDPHSRRGERDVYIAGAHGIVARQDGKWHDWKSPRTFTDVSGGFAASGPPMFYAVSEHGAFVSRDGGASWSEIALPGSGAGTRAVAASLHHPEVAYISYNNLTLDGQKWLGVARTRDGGSTWNLVWKENDAAPGANIHDAWIAERMGATWGENPLSMGVADQDPNLCYGTDFGRALLTTDGGANWNAVYSKRVPGGAWTSTGLDVTTDYGYFFDPFDSRRRFIAYTDIGLMRSEDAGRSWTRSVEGVPRAWTNTTYWLVFDPDVRGRMWGVMSYTHDLPRPKMWRRPGSLQRYRGGVCRSDDGGRTWKRSNAGMPETAPTHILMDPSSPKDARVLYVAAMGRGVYKSSDGGATWALKNNGITQQNPLAWRLTRAGDGTLYLLIARRSEHGEIGNENDGAIYRSKDGGENWQRVTLPAGVNGPNGLAIDPRDPRRLYLAAWARATGMHGEGGGVFLSTDAGQTWSNVLDRDQHVYDVTIDPRDAKVLYACGFESSAWRSTDAGEHWTRIPGYNFKWGHRVIPDPENAMKVYITTFGGSVWHGAVDGEDRPLDIATPEMTPGVLSR
jgi:photosystem II stability/assembly factor-like uncharacterized protein